MEYLCNTHKELINRHQVKNYTFPIYTVADNKVKISEKMGGRASMANRISTIAFAIFDAIKLEERASLTGIGFANRD